MEDKELIRRIREEKDQKAFSTLMERYRRSLFFTMLKMVRNRDDAEDLTLEAFSKAFNRIDSYNDDYAFSTWLFRIASNNAIDFMRKKRLETTSLDEPVRTEGDGTGDALRSLLPDDSDDPEETMIRKQRYRVLAEMVDELAPKYRDLVKLRYFDELKYDEISKQLDMPSGTVKVRLSRARKLLLKLYEDRQRNADGGSS